MLDRFLNILFTRGEVIFRKPPLAVPARDPEALRVLEAEYRRYALDMPGTVPAFDADTALKAAEILRDACWFLLSHEEDDAEVARRLEWPGLASTPAQHVSADLTLRFAARVHRRAKALNPADALVRSLENTLRRRPLSGVLCEIDQAPLTLDFADHDGLMLQYAERLADNPKRDWTPDGRAREYLEFVLDRRGVKNSPLLAGVA
ncbi:MAG: hypothetical protein H6839_16225 [Planctomycetes bacterium]|nr:hypothetical protein [Planctomycetota bacterium]